MLEPWYRATLLCSGSYYPTSHMLVLELFELSQSIRIYRTDKTFGNEVVAMQSKFIKYYDNYPTVAMLPQLWILELNLES